MIINYFAFIFLIFTIIITLLVYYYSFKTYGIKITIICSLLLTSVALIGIISGGYNLVDLTIYPIFTVNLFGNEFLFTDPIGIFPSFFITFELGRIALNKFYRTYLTYKSILKISLLVSFFGFCYQILIDTTAGAIGFYYFEIIPILNIFGFPIPFLLSFTIYGVFGLLFLLLEKNYYKNKKEVDRFDKE